MNRERQPPGNLFFLLAAKERTKENCRCFDAVRGCARGATVERSETGERTMIAPAGQSTARACLRSKLAALVVRRQAGPRLRGCTPLRTPKRKSEGAGAKRKQYYFSFLTPPPLPPPLSRGLRGCERGATVERSETGERAMFAPAGQTTARAGLRSKLAALVVRRQAPPNPRCRKQQSVGAGHARPAALPLPPLYLLNRREGS